MKPSLQRKISAFKDQKSKKGNLQALIKQKRKNLEKMMGNVQLQKENDFKIQNYGHQIDMKHQRYLEDMDQLQNTKFKIIQLKGNLDSLQVQLSYQEDQLAHSTRGCEKEIGALEDILGQLRQRMARQAAQKVNMEEERCQRHLEHVQKLTNQKEELIHRTEQLLLRRKTLDMNLKKLKDSFEDDYKKQRDGWGKNEQERKERWQAKKLEEVTETTLRGLQPQIQRIVGSSKRQILKTQEKYQSLNNAYKDEMNAQFEANLKQIKKGISDRIEDQKVDLMDKSNDQYRRLTQKLVEFYESEKLRLKSGKQAEIRQLQAKRRGETQQFLSKNKDYLLSHLQEVKILKANYQKQIQELDSSLDKLLQKQQKAIRDKHARKVEIYKDEQRKVLEQKLRTYHMKLKQQNQNNYEDLVEKVAVQNQAFQSEVKKRTNARSTQLKQTSETEIKSIRKGLQYWLNRENQEKQQFHRMDEVRQGVETEHDELRQECEYLKRKQAEYKSEVVRLKSKEGELLESEQQQQVQIGQYWEEQMVILRNKMMQVEKDIETQQEVMREKQEEEEKKSAQMWNQLQKVSLMAIKRINGQIDRARKQKQMKTVLNGKLIQTRKKVKQLEVRRGQQ